MNVILPLRTVSESNRRGHWSKHDVRRRHQRGTVGLVMRAARWAAFPVVVTLTRIAPRELDDDNLRGALKAVRDGVADGLGINDRDPRVRWEYEQRRGKPREYAVGIRIEPA